LSTALEIFQLIFAVLQESYIRHVTGAIEFLEAGSEVETPAFFQLQQFKSGEDITSCI
jgi:hypothetical protein